MTDLRARTPNPNLGVVTRQAALQPATFFPQPITSLPPELPQLACFIAIHYC